MRADLVDHGFPQIMHGHPPRSLLILHQQGKSLRPPRQGATNGDIMYRYIAPAV